MVVWRWRQSQWCGAMVKEELCERMAEVSILSGRVVTIVLFV